MSRISFLVIFCASLIFRLGANYDDFKSYDFKINGDASISTSHSNDKGSILFFETFEEVEYEEDDDAQKHFYPTFFESYLKTTTRLEYLNSCKSINQSPVTLDRRPIYILYDHLLI